MQALLLMAERTVEARELLNQAIALAQAEKTRPQAAAQRLNELGKSLADLRKPEDSLKAYMAAMTILERTDRESVDLAESLNGLGMLALHKKELPAARDYLQHALTIREQLAPDSLSVAESLVSLGDVAESQGDLAAARDFYQRALKIKEKLAPGSIGVAENLDKLGIVAQGGDDWKAAREYFRRALDIKEKVAPGSLSIATSYNSLGGVARRRGDLTMALQLATRAWTITRQHASDISGDEARQAFGSRYAFIGANLVQYQVALGKAMDAFVTLEEGRAQALQQMLMERNTAKRLAPVNVWQAYVEAQRTCDQREKALEKAVEAETNATATLGAMLAQRGGDTAIAASRQALESVRRDAEAVRAEYTQARLEAERRWGDVRQAVKSALPAPVDVKRVHELLPAGVVWVEFSLGERAKGMSGKETVLVVGNPLFDRAPSAELPAAKATKREDGELALLSRDGTIPEPLPGAEEEAREVAALYGVKAWIGAEPTEKWFRERAGEAEIIHLATHGYFNPYRALSSGVMLAAPETRPQAAETDNDGALQAWEIFSQIELRAELVLSPVLVSSVKGQIPDEATQ